MRERAFIVLLAGLAASCAGEKAAPPAPASAVPEAAPGGSPGAVKPLPDVLPEVIAKVNGRPIYLRNAVMVAERLMGPSLVSLDGRAKAYRGAMDQLVTRELLFQEALARKFAPETAVVEKAYDASRARFKSDAEWQTFLKQQGLDEQGYKTELRAQHTIEALLRREGEAVPAAVSDPEARAFYDANPKEFEVGERVRARHILVRVAKDAAPALHAEQKRKAEGLRARIGKGEDFGAVASASSEDEATASQGGGLPPLPRGVMAPPFEQAAFALKPGEVSGVVETSFGFHIIKLEERLPPEKETFEQAMDRIREHLLTLRRQAAVKALIDTLKAKAEIETFL